MKHKRNDPMCDPCGSYGFLITKELIFGFEILDLKDHFSASLKPDCYFSELQIQKVIVPMVTTVPFCF